METYLRYEDEVKESHQKPTEIELKEEIKSSKNEETPNCNEDLLSICRYLKEIGYSLSTIIALIENIHITSSNQAIDLLVKTESGFAHPFIPNHPEAGEQVKCKICQDSYKEHLQSYADEAIPNLADISIILKSDNKNIAEIEDVISKLKLEYDICPICSENYNNLAKIKACGHTMCQSCIESYIKSKLSENSVLKIICPYKDCKVELGEKDIEELCGKEQFQKYKYLLNNYRVNTSSNLKWCPNSQCGKIIEGSTSNPQAVCKACGFEICFKCGNQWHPGASCDKFVDNKYSEWAKNKVLEKCPNCKMIVEKNSGCNHMTCVVCQYQWCWLCGQKYTSTHFNTSLFGCIGWQYTTYVSFFGFLMKVIATLIFWPFICFCMMLAGDYFSWFCDMFNNCHGCGVLLRLFLMPLLGVCLPIFYLALLPPSWIYQIFMNFWMVFRWKYLKA